MGFGGSMLISGRVIMVAILGSPNMACLSHVGISNVPGRRFAPAIPTILGVKNHWPLKLVILSRQLPAPWLSMVYLIRFLKLVTVVVFFAGTVTATRQKSTTDGSPPAA